MVDPGIGAVKGEAMHALGRFVQDLMDEIGMTPAALVRASGLSKQHVSQMLDDSKTRLGRMIANKTIVGLAAAFPEVGEGSFITRAAEAMGVPVDRLESVSPNYQALSNEALLGILRDRLKGAQWPATEPIEDEVPAGVDTSPVVVLVTPEPGELDSAARLEPSKSDQRSTPAAPRRGRR